MAMTGGTSVLVHTGYGNSQSNFPIKLYVYYKVTQNATAKTSTITLGMYVTTPGGNWDIGPWSDYRGSYVGTTSNTFSGAIPNFSGTYWIVENKTMTVTHDADGRKTATIYWKWGVNSPWGQTQDPSGSFNITLPPFAVYTLSTSAGTGSSITVNRQTCAGSGATGNLSNGAALWYNDVLKITFTPSTNYSITTHTVNGSTFTSGNTKTVTGNVSVVATATPLKSSLGATDANIGSTSTLTVTRYNTSYTHTITYKLGSATGTICTKSSQTSIAWTVPTTFYAQIPNNKTGTCTLTIETFNGNTSLGSSTCTLTVTASSSACEPTVSGTVVDTNSTTTALTGDSSILIVNKSNARCTITATPKNSATITELKINNNIISGASSGDAMTGNETWNGVTATSFVFKATDSRGYSKSITVRPTIINYVTLTLNPVLTRVSPTGTDVTLSFSGNFYKGSLGAYTNTLTIQYRYKESSAASYPATWTDVASADIITYTSNTYRSRTTLTLPDAFDYQKSYDFQIRAVDGANGTALSTVRKDIVVKQGIPVFDWGENDFNFHVPIKIGNTTLTEAQLQQLLALIT